MDFFKETIYKKKRSATDIMTIIIAILGALLLLRLLTLQIYLQISLLITLLPLEYAGVIYGAYRIIIGTSVEYEYSVTNDTLDIDKIIARKSRKKILSVSSRSFEYFAPLSEEHKRAFEDSDISKKIDVISGNGAPLYFAVYYNNSEKTRLVFEPTAEMIENFSRYVPRSLNHTV